MKISAVARKKSDGVLNAMKMEFLNQTPAICSAILKINPIDACQAIFKVLLSGSGAEKDLQKVLTDHKEAAYIFRVRG